MTNEFVNLVHYICWRQTGEAATLGATKLNKILWYVDTISYRMNGASITSDKYVKQEYGPTPFSILQAIERLKSEDKLMVSEPKAKYQPRLFFSKSHPNTEWMDEGTRELVDSIIDDIVCNHTATSISNETHDSIWHAAKIGEEIPMCAVLATNEAELDEDDIEWAVDVITGTGIFGE